MRVRWWLTLVLVAGEAFAGPGRRFALVVGENRGLEREEQLRFAERDAAKMRDVLLDVGGFRPGDVTVLLGTDATGVRQALSTLKAAMDGTTHERLVVYVSSHAGDGALHLAGSGLALDELVAFVKAAPVQVAMLIVDACQSGSVTRTKGLKATGEPVTPRMQATGVEGRVFISASGADEYAQESDALGGSYFTHHLIAGLRGAADASHDGTVTLDEAYAWAWARTVEATFSSRSGVQRPAFNVDLRGAGQLVLSEPKHSASRLNLDVDAPGRWLLVAEASGTVVADVEKGRGPLLLAVASGRYRLQLRVSDAVLERTVTVPKEGEATVSGADLERVSLLRVARKGGEEATVMLLAGGSVSSALVAGFSTQPGATLRVVRDAHLVSFLNQVAGNFDFRDGQATSGTFKHVEFEVRLSTGHRFSIQNASLGVGVELGALLIFQSNLPNQGRRTSLGATGCVSLEGRIRLVGPLEAFALGTAGGAAVKKLAGPTVVPRLSASLGLGVVF
jgi:Caspase domain